MFFYSLFSVTKTCDHQVSVLFWADWWTSVLICLQTDPVLWYRLLWGVPYLALVFIMPSEPQQLFVLPRHKVDGGVLQQRREDEQETHGHPDVDGLDVRDLRTRDTRVVWVSLSTDPFTVCWTGVCIKDYETEIFLLRLADTSLKSQILH